MNSFSLAPNRQKMAICCKELDSIRGIFNEKEKELSVAMAKCDALNRQLDELKDGNIINSYNMSTTTVSPNEVGCQANNSKFNVELEKLKQELLYRTKLNEKINDEVMEKQKQIDQRTIELKNIDERINELKSRLNRKRSLNEQLNAQMKMSLLKSDSSFGNQSKTSNDNPNNDVPNCNHSIRPATLRTLRRSIGAGQPYKFTHLKPLQRHPNSELQLTSANVSNSAHDHEPKSTSNLQLHNVPANDLDTINNAMNNETNNMMTNTTNITSTINTTNGTFGDSTCTANKNTNNQLNQLNHGHQQQIISVSNIRLEDDLRLVTSINVNNPHQNDGNQMINNHLNNQEVNHQPTNNQTNHSIKHSNNQKNEDSVYFDEMPRKSPAKYMNHTSRLDHTPLKKRTSESSQMIPNQRLSAISNTAKYLIVDRNQKELVNSTLDAEFDKEMNNLSRVNISNHLNNHLNHLSINSPNSTNNLNTSTNDLIKPNSSPALSSVSSSSDFVSSTSSSASDLTYQTNSTHRFTTVQPTVSIIGGQESNSIRQGHKSTKQLQLTSSVNGDHQSGGRVTNDSAVNKQLNFTPTKVSHNVFNESHLNDESTSSTNDHESTKLVHNRPDVERQPTELGHDRLDAEYQSTKLMHNRPDIIVDSGDRTHFVNTSLSNNSSSTNANESSHDAFKFSLLQTSLSSKPTSFNQSSHNTSTNATDSESDLSSEASEKYTPLIKSTTPATPVNRLVEKNNELKKSTGDSSTNKAYSDDLKISIDNSDWLRKRRPLVAHDIDLEKHFDLNSEQLFNSTNLKLNSEKSTIMNNELNRENYCNGNMNRQEQQDHSANDLIKEKTQLNNIEVMSSSSSSNHSPNSFSDELDASKIELRSVIRNIMCKNLGSSSDKSSTMSEEDETDEDENSVDCKAKVNDMKPSSIKTLQSTIEHQENELNKSKEKSILNKMSCPTINHSRLAADRYDDSVDEKEDSENYDSNNSEERADESSKDENTDDQEKCNSKSNLKKQFGKKRRVSFDPLALFLDAALEGELELVKKTATQVSNPSESSEGVTALHNAICAGHFDIVKFLVEIGCDINAQDHDGWTPLHCAASCNNLPMVKYLVEHGACIFAVTLSDHETPAQKCEEMEDGYQGCSKYLYSMQEMLGVLNGGSVYADYDYNAQRPDELSFKCGELLRILSKSDESETEWWWASNSQQANGYVPRNLLSIYPRVSPKSKETIELENS